MRLALLFAAVLVLPSTAARAFDLTGTWTGKYTCKGSDGVKFKFSVKGTLEITQVGDQIAMQLPFDGGADVYNAVAITDVSKPEKGSIYYVHCGMSDVPGNGVSGFDEAGFANVNAKANGKGSFKGTTAWYFTEPPPGGGNCKWTYKRTSTANPNVPGCLAIKE